MVLPAPPSSAATAAASTRWSSSLHGIECVLLVRIGCTDGCGPSLGVVLAKLLDAMQLERLLLLVVDVVQHEKLEDRVQLHEQGCGLE